MNSLGYSTYLASRVPDILSPGAGFVRVLSYCGRVVASLTNSPNSIKQAMNTESVKSESRPESGISLPLPALIGQVVGKRFSLFAARSAKTVTTESPEWLLTCLVNAKRLS